MPTFTLTPLFTGPVEPNDLISFELSTASDFPTLTGVIFSLSYNADDVRFDGVTFASPFDSLTIPQSEPAGASGEIVIENFQGGFFALPGTGVGGENTIATLTFEALSEVNATSIRVTPTTVFFGDPTLTIADVTLPEPVSITVNLPPVAQDDTATTDEDTSVEIDVLDGDTDGGGPPSIQSFGQASNGTVSQTAGGLTYDPDPDFNGIDTFTYTIVDSAGATDTATVTVNVAAVNDDPIGNDDTASTDKDDSVVISVLANDSDVDVDRGEAQTLTVSGAGGATDGSVSVTDGGATVTYTPDTGFVGEDTFTYTVADGAGGTDTATATVTVNETNIAPVGVDDTVTTNEDTPVTFDPTSNDTDADTDTLSVESFGQGATGTVTEAGGQLVYTPDADFNGTDSFTYTVADGNGGTDTATVSVTVDPQPDEPIARNDTATTGEDAPVTIDVLANDSDADNDTLTILSVDAATPATNGAVSIENGQVLFTPDADFEGTTSFLYTVTDGENGFDTASVTVTVTGENDPPVAGDDSATTAEDTAVDIDVLANDSDADNDTLTVAILSGDGPAQGGAVVNGDGTITYTPAEDSTGEDSFTYTVDDGNGGTDTATVTVTVTGENDPPVAGDDSVTTDEDVAVEIGVLANDEDADGDALTILANTDPSNGTLLLADGAFTYTPADDFSGTDSFTYTIGDGSGAESTATVSITVDPVNDAPVAGDDVRGTAFGNPVLIDVLANDGDPENDPLSIDAAGPAANGSVEIVNDEIRYTPDADFIGQDSFEYTISDGNGGTDTATVEVSVTGITFAPATTGPITPGSVIEIEFRTTAGFPEFAGVNAALTYDADDLEFLGATPANPPFDVFIPPTDLPTTPQGLTTLAPFAFSDVFGEDGPIAGELLIGTFSFRALSSDTTTVSIGGQDGLFFINDALVNVFGGTAQTTLELNAAPVAADDSISLDEDTSITLGPNALTGNDSDSDGDAITIQSVGAASHGTVDLLADGSVIYTPDAEFSGSDSFTYTVTDGGLTDTATVSVTVNPLNDAPILGALDPVFDVVERSDEIVFQATASDVDDTGLTFSLANGDAALFDIDPATGEVSFKQAPLFADGNSTFSFDVAVSDGELQDSENVTVNVLKDTDADFVPDREDNAIKVFNPEQIDTNGDGLGNAADADFNDDLTVDILDLIIFRNAFRESPLPEGIDKEDMDIAFPRADDGSLTDPLGTVDLQDLIRFTDLFGQTITPDDTAFFPEIA